MKKTGSPIDQDFHENASQCILAGKSRSKSNRDPTLFVLSDFNAKGGLNALDRSQFRFNSLASARDLPNSFIPNGESGELPSSSVFIPLNTSVLNNCRGRTPSTRESVNCEESIVLDDLKSSQTFVDDYGDSESSNSGELSARPPCRRRGEERQSRVRLSEMDTGGLCQIFHSSIPAIGHWICMESIGEGSQGSIFKGSSITHDGFEFAVKLVHNITIAHGDFDSLPEEAKTEIENMASLSHPNIVKCYGAEILGNHLYIYMELMKGGSIARFIMQKGHLNEELASRYTRQVLEAIYYLHSKRHRPVMHRDIKGSNVLLSEDFSQVILCDFGSSTRQIQQNLKRLTRISPTAVAVVDLMDPKSCYTSFCHDTNDLNDFVSSSIKGTCNWIAPEVLTGQPYSARCDVWSLGCLVIEMLTAKVPWKSFENPVAAMYNIMTSNSTPIEYIPADRRNELSEICVDFLARCLDRNMDTRWTAKRLLKHAWVRSTLPTIPGTPAGLSSPGTPVVTRAII